MTTSFRAIRVRRRTAETDFEVQLAPRAGATPSLPIPNRLLSHFVDHFAKASGIALELREARWPRSWEFDHVLCEDMGQLIGHGVAAIAAERVAAAGIPGRATAAATMDGSMSQLTLSLESRPRCHWSVVSGVDIDGFVDSWYGQDGSVTGSAYGTNLRQFFDGFAYGSGASLRIEVVTGGNLHHVYETVFRALGDATAAALGLGGRVAGESSGLAGPPRYEVEPA